MYDVFISYVTPDQNIAEYILAYLENNDLSCFFAPRDMKNRAGSHYAKELVDAMKNSRLQLLLHSENVNRKNKNIIAELDVAWELDVPTLLVELDEAEHCNEVIYYTSTRQKVSCLPENFSAAPEKMETYMPIIAESIKNLLDDEEARSGVSCKEPPVTKFRYDPRNGSMYNPRDGIRNVSFRTDTFINMMSDIYKKVASISDSEAKAQEIFFGSGYESGRNFATRINSQWGSGFSPEEILKKIQRWCEFDSVVGWGRFEADIQIDEENDTLGGSLTIIEAFIVDPQDKSQVCAFIRGYCTGVLTTLAGGFEVELTCSSCPHVKKLSRKCVFEVKMKG